MGDFGKALVKLNVGGTIFETRLETLDRGCKQGSQVLQELCSTARSLHAQQTFSSAPLNIVLTLDRNGSIYQWVLDFLRDSVIHDVPPHSREALVAEAGYLQLPLLASLVKALPTPRDILQALSELEISSSSKNQEIVARIEALSGRLIDLEKRVASVELAVEDSKFRSGADLSRLDFIRILAAGNAAAMRIQGLNLIRVDLHALDFSGVRFDRCNLTAANLEGAVLTGCSFRNAVLKGANFTRAVMDQSADFKGAVIDQGTVFTDLQWSTTLVYTGTIQEITLPPLDGKYYVCVKGAGASDGTRYRGGRGAVIEGELRIKAGTTLRVLVGGMSKRNERASGGAGGSFVVATNDELLVAAGGGGGAGDCGDGGDASTTQEGERGGPMGGAGGVLGSPGKEGYYCHAGAGWFEDAIDGAKCFKNGGAGGGKFGGFGGGGDCAGYGGSGGGGFSGGGGGHRGGTNGGGGGGSFVHEGMVVLGRSVGNLGHGEVTFRLLSLISDSDQA